LASGQRRKADEPGESDDADHWGNEDDAIGSFEPLAPGTVPCAGRRMAIAT
jgi:hypothetical protein